MRMSCVFLLVWVPRECVCICGVRMSAGANIIQWQMHGGKEIRWKIHQHGRPREHVLSHRHTCAADVGYACHRRFVFMCVGQAITTQSNQSLRTENTSTRPATRSIMVCEHALGSWCRPLYEILIPITNCSVTLGTNIHQWDNPGTSSTQWIIRPF